MELILKSKFEVGDIVYMGAFGMDTYREVKIFKVEIAKDKKSFIYKILAHPQSWETTYNYVHENWLYKSLNDLQDSWQAELNFSKKY